MSDVTREGEAKIQRWKTALMEKDRAKKALTSAECEVANAEIELQKWLTPADYQIGEKFCVAYESSFIQVEILSNNRFELKMRPRNK
jgi:hypothetical protein